jgi:hypothetical protein
MGKWYRRRLDAWLNARDGAMDPDEFERRINAGLELPPERRAVPIADAPPRTYPPEPEREEDVGYWYGEPPKRP